MSMTKMPISNTLKIMDLCNNGRDIEAMKMCGLNPEIETAPDGDTFIDRVITVANSTLNMTPSNQEVLVPPSIKQKGPEGAINDVVDGVKNMANDSIDESVSRIIENINYFDKLITHTILEGEDGNSVPSFKYNFIKIERYIKKNYPDVYEYIINKYVSENNFHAVGIIMLYKAYDDCKANGSVSVEDIKFAEKSIPSSFRNSNKFIFKLNESSSLDEIDVSGKYYFSSFNSCVKKNNHHSISEAIDVFFEDEDGENQGAIDYINKDNPETKSPEEEKSNMLTNNVKELADAIQEFISTIPEKVKDLTNKLSVVITGKDVYVGLIVSAFVSCGAIYLIYKTNKSKEEGNSSVSECVNAFREANYFINRIYEYLDEDASNVESFESESEYIKSAINVAMELDSKGYKSEFFEKCVTNVATLYDTYLSDASKLK